jgi:hypothetical protein
MGLLFETLDGGQALTLKMSAVIGVIRLEVVGVY